MSIATPPVITAAFAFNAGASFITTPIPVSPPVDPDRASFDQGFPESTFATIVAGGVPPDGRDFNGILNMTTAHDAYQQAGQPYVYNAAVPAAVTGYGVGAQLGMLDGTGFWFNLVANNAVDPDTTNTGWVPSYSYGFATVSGLTGGAVTLTTAQHRRNTIVLQGTLTSNLQVVFPTSLREWRVVNQCTGAFTVTCKTAAGTGVVVAAGSFSSPVSIYGDGTNLYPSVAPFSVPISIAATASSLVQRDASAFAYAAYWNQSSGLEVPTIGAVFVQNSGADGFLRKISLTNFQSQLALSLIGGAVTAAQVPLGAVTQYAASILANAALTGTPTAPTAAAGTSNTQVATTEFANPAQTQAQTGFVKLPGGVIIQWGYTQGAAGAGTVTITFPIAFPSSAFIGVCSTANRTAAGSNGYNFTSSLTPTGMVAAFDVQTNGFRGGYWIAIGV